ncbi:TerC family protein [Bacillus sp. EB106-08-02-XG196]|jgi:YkoY family integral membrane protein|uniref:TerC family protein n=1 Tax=Bacillus sp. EB106-08-02-XG196 TaxID=2737049 RepID=UPI0015C42C08|nr:TerC family protein [Bacillus sp. EB106-08-02-XG196]NWQ42633.1 TerC family protein [Bacillus sp. EB106-08-02-XG196]
MEFLQEIITNYGSFLSLDALVDVLTDPASWGIIGTLVILEGLLSADNALVLAVLVKHLPEEQRKKALFYGIIGAYLFRVIAIGIGVTLINIGWIKIVGGHYLLWLVLQHFMNKRDGEEDIQTKQVGFWSTVLTVELMDIAFSIDSVIAAFGVSNQVWVLFFGGILGILMMRGVAQLFLALIERIPEFETTAFILIGIIGLRMIAAAFGFQMHEVIFFSILIGIFIGTFLVHFLKGKLTTR